MLHEKRADSEAPQPQTHWLLDAAMGCVRWNHTNVELEPTVKACLVTERLEA